MRTAAKPQVGNFTALAEAPISRQEMHTIGNLVQFFMAQRQRGAISGLRRPRVSPRRLPACPRARQPALRSALQTWAWRVNLANR